jgi:hypothetical protein
MLSAPSRRHRNLPLLALICVSLAAPLVAAQVTALPGGAPIQLPRGGFEAGQITTYQYEPTWPGWTMGPGTGIANDGSALTIENPPAPGATHVAFAEGTGAFSTSRTFAAGVWRLRFSGAQRKVGGVADRQVVQVTIGGTEVFEAELSGTEYATYTTRAVRFASSATRQVTFQGLGSSADMAFLDIIEVEPIAEWGASSTWDTASVPGSSDDVVIPAGAEVALRDAAVVATVMVEGELLTTFDSATLNARWVAVMGPDARFEVGRELTPYTQDFTLTLTGLEVDETFLEGTSMEMEEMSKFLLAMDGGTIDLHGKPKGMTLTDGRQRTWTKLAATVDPYFDQITLLDAMPWEVGDEIVIAGSRQPDTDPELYEDQAEKRVISQIAGNVLTLQPTMEPSFAHFGASSGETYSNGTRSWTLDRRAEVGLLSHNVVVQGDTLSPGHQGFGGHVMMMRGECCTTGGRGRFSNVELYRVGQKAKAGRYPVHWHMQQGEGAGQFLKNCSVHESYNRAVTIHGTESLVIEGNVAYRHVGHGIFLEDGSERFNQLYHNLALSTFRPPASEALLPSDHSPDELQNRAPATYWITNPNNELVGNVAAGTIGTGFWFIFPTAPLGLSGDDDEPWASDYFDGLEPDHEPLGLFVDNVSHSSSSGFDVNDSITRNTHEVVPNHPWNPHGSADQYLEGLTVYGCFAGLYTGGGEAVYDRIRFRECVLADNLLNLVFAGYNVLEDSAVIAHSQSGFYSGYSFGYMAYDGAGRVFDSHFVGFTEGTTLVGDIGAATKHTYHHFRGLTFDPPSPPRIELPDFAASAGIYNYADVHDDQEPRRWGIAIADEDGSLLQNYAEYTLISNHPMMRSSSDVTDANWLASSSSPSAYLSPLSFAHLRIDHPNWDYQSGPLPTIKFTRYLVNHPDVTFVNGYNTDTHKQIPVIVNPEGVASDAWYRIRWPGVPANGELRVTLDDLHKLDDWVSTRLLLGVTHSLQPGFGDYHATLQLTHDGVAIPAFGSLAALDAATETGYFVDVSSPSPKPLYVRIVRADDAMKQVVDIAW